MTTRFGWRKSRSAPFLWRRHRPQEGIAAKEWHYISPDAPLIVPMLKSVRDDARAGRPDPVHGTAAPAAFTQANQTFGQLVEDARNRALDEINEDVEFVVASAEAVLAARRVPLPDVPEDRERVARLDAEFGRRLARLEVREAQHEAEVDELTQAARMTTALLEGAWKACHPHPDYLGHFPLPQFQVPPNAYEIGQARVRAALGRAGGTQS